MHFSHWRNPNPPGWFGYLNPFGSKELEKFWVNKFGYCWKKNELSTTGRWVLVPLWTSSSTVFRNFSGWDSTWESGGMEGTYMSLLVQTVWAAAWFSKAGSGTVLTPKRLAQSKFPEPRFWKLNFSSCCWFRREFMRCKAKKRSSISGNDSNTSSKWDEDNESLLCSLLETLAVGFREFECFL